MSEVGTQYFLGNTEIINSFVGDVQVLINPFEFKPPLPTQSLFAYYDAKNINSYPGSGSIWYDISGNNRNLFITASVSASFTSSVFPTFNSFENSLEFNGNNGLISEAISSSIAQTHAITQVAWVKLANLSSSVGVMAVQQGASGTGHVGDNQGYFSGIAYGPTGSNYRWRISSEPWTPDRAPIYSSVNETAENEWIMMAATLTFGGGLPENNLFTLYRNGNNVLASGSGLNINWFRSTGSLVVGAQYYNSAPAFGVQFDSMFSGSISSVLYYNRALSANEIEQIYEYGR